MHVLLVASAFNSLTQRVHAELRDRGHTVSVELVPGQAAFAPSRRPAHMTPLPDGRTVPAGTPAPPDGSPAEAVRRHAPHLVLAPMLKAAIPREVWTAYPCFIVHPGPVGDRGPSSLDWAVQEGAGRWGVTVLQAREEMDAGDIWATVACPLPPVPKSDLYRGEIADAALAAVLLAVERFASGTHTPLPQDTARTRPYLDQSVRRIDWGADTTGTVLAKLRAADSQPGVLDTLLGEQWYLHGGHPEDVLRGTPGDLLATRNGAVCRATADGAVWIPELRPRRRPGQPRPVKLPAVTALGERLPPLPRLPALTEPRWRTWTDIRYREQGSVGFLSFSFPGGAMSTEQCERLLHAYRDACDRPTSVLVLGGPRDFFSNGIHLGVIEAAEDPAAESWANINAMDDLVEAVLTTTDRLVVAALAGNAAAGGAMLALAADEVWCRAGCVLNPHYRLMGLYGSEYWTYTLPRRVGARTADRLMSEALPLSAVSARDLGLVDQVIGCGPQNFAAEVARLAARLASLPGTRARIAAKKEQLEQQEAVEPLSAFRERELAEMRRTFQDPAAAYHALRRAFTRKEGPSCTPPYLARVTGRGAGAETGRSETRTSGRTAP
ncbi:enoyl-CoA hydratase-related protein [Streptomyces sp. NPDC047022]|uniref:enoyl-CoA hydratase-related protein n=1 Tax=Streptomyces sp. NPDC047022 TaxID=3155737 RepID=UPI0033E55020